ncbi:MAG: hypothetical protein C0631_18820 [Sedimenticola sp.]|nr:MAG: hypothetical protein C0631_18820 [Sedimenticola sp.]
MNSQKKTIQGDTLSTEQWDALCRFAGYEGRQWKSVLAQCWRNGCYPWHVKNTSNDEAYLQQIRNRRGPGWLMKCNLRLG